MRTMESNRLQQATAKTVRRSIQSVLKLLDRQIADTIRQDPICQQIDRILQSVCFG